MKDFITDDFNPFNENTTRIRMGCLPASVNTQFIQRVIACRELTTMVK